MPAPSMRSLARLAGVSAMTVSMALRNHPRVASVTKDRIQRLARDHGYTPEPEVTKLMRYLRLRRGTRIKPALCALVSRGHLHEYGQLIARSARQRAASLGYSLDHVYVDDYLAHMRRLPGVLRSRGIEGVLLMPMGESTQLVAAADWSDFSLVATSYSLLNLPAHHVVPHQFSNCIRACSELTRLGYRRLGLVLTRQHDVRVHHHYAAALAWHNVNAPEPVRPLICETLVGNVIRSWFEREKPDAILSAGDDQAFEIIRLLSAKQARKIRLVSMSLSRNSRAMGIDERPEEVGARAIDLLANMILRGEKGIPVPPIAIMVEGAWSAGRPAL